jgi:glutaredoxin-like YruB-family protein
MEKPTKQKEIIIYSTETCPYCKMVKQYFDENKIKYVDLDVSRDEKAAEEMIKKSGQMGVPVIDINGQIVVGFDKNELARILE